MLSTQSAEVVRTTLPAVAASLDTITTRFYTTMFAERPELLDGLFDRGNQASGEQSRALAASIAGFASTLLDNPDKRPDALLARIAHKHAAVAVTDDQYVIVHKYLFGAIADVLGDAATPEVVAAWDEVYWLMAGALISLEARLYAEAGTHDGTTWRQWTVVERREEVPDVISLELRPNGDAPVPPARPGQYVSVRMPMPDGTHQLRQYSLSGSIGTDLRRITIKRVRGTRALPDGEVSTLLHDTIAEGDELTLSAPFGDIHLEDGEAPVVLISAGIGCTPIAAMLRHLSDTGSRRRVLALHADYAKRTHALRHEMKAMVGALPDAEHIVWYEDGDCDCARQGRMDLSDVAIPEGAEVYLCGPVPFMRDVRGQLLKAGLPARAIHYEVFGPDLWLGADD